MSLQLVVGGGGSKKSTALFESIIKQAVASPRGQFYVIVPEQFTMHTQRRLVQLHPAHSITNIDVLSFERLAYRIFEELGLQRLEVLEETGKSLLLRRIAQEQKEQLRILGRAVERPGTIGQLKSLISELMQYNISEAQLQELLSKPQVNGVFEAKVCDLLLLYKEYNQSLQGRYITAEQVLQQLVKVIERSAKLKGAVVAFDGFTGFTPLQYLLLEKLLPMTQSVIATITCQEQLQLGVSPAETDLFEMGKTMANRLVELAKLKGVAVEPINYVESEPEGLASVELASLPDPRTELAYVAASIESKVRTEGLRYRDFAIVCPTLETYSHLVPQVFGKLNMPFFLDEKASVTFQPFLEVIRAFLQAMDENLSYRGVIGMLRTGLLDVSPQEVDELENYILATRLRGWKRYSQPLTRVPKYMYKRDEMLEQINATRESFIAPMLEFRSSLGGKKQGTVAEISAALYNWIIHYNMEEKLAERAEEYEQAGEDAKAKEFAGIYAAVMSLLDKLVHILGDERVTIEAYSELLASGFEAIKIGRIPPVNDGVVIGDMQRTRLAGVKYVYLLGAIDGAIPKAAEGGGILNQADRIRFFEEGLEIAPTDRIKTFRERFYLYFILSQPTQGMIVTFPRVNGEGNGTHPSYIISSLQKEYPHANFSCLNELPLEYHLLTPAMAKEYFLSQLRAYADGGSVSPEFEAYLAMLKQENAEQFNQFIDAAYFAHKDDKISAAAVSAVYGQQLKMSVSRLERFARCAYAYFLEYGLKLAPREEYGLDSMDIGNFYHEVLCKYSELMRGHKTITWANATPQQRQQLLEQAFAKVYEAFPTALEEDLRQQYQFKRMEQTLEQTVWAIGEQIKAGAFEPTDFEVEFKNLSDLDTLKIEIDEMHTISLTGKIDRIDLCQQHGKVYVKIVDYKSSKHDFDINKFYHGLQVQLVLYTSVAHENMVQRFPGSEVQPAAMFYYHVHKPMLQWEDDFAEASDDKERQQIMERAILKELKMSGRLESSDDVVAALDSALAGCESMAKSIHIPAGYKKDGTLDSRSRVLSAEEFSLLEDHARLQLQCLGRDMLGGKVDVNPFKFEKDNKDGCEYCDFKGVCRFEADLPGFDYRKLSKGTEEEVMAQIDLEVKGACNE